MTKIIENIIKVTDDIEGQCYIQSDGLVDNNSVSASYTHEKYFLNSADANDYEIDSDSILEDEVYSNISVGVSETEVDRSVETVSVDEIVKYQSYIIEQQFPNYEIKEMKYTIDNVEFVKKVLIEKVNADISKSESA